MAWSRGEACTCRQTMQWGAPDTQTKREGPKRAGTPLYPVGKAPGRAGTPPYLLGTPAGRVGKGLYPLGRAAKRVGTPLYLLGKAPKRVGMALYPLGRALALFVAASTRLNPPSSHPRS